MRIGIEKDEKKNSITEIDKLPFYYSLLLLLFSRIFFICEGRRSLCDAKEFHVGILWDQKKASFVVNTYMLAQ